MAEQTQKFEFRLSEVASALVKVADLHEGHWMLTASFGFGVGNVGDEVGKSLSPTAMVPLVGLGLERVETPNLLSVDAAKVNPQG